MASDDSFDLLVWGPNACFTRPEMKVERVSYEVMTPSAARGVLEAILWKPEFGWQVEQIHVLKPIRWEAVRRNEVGVRMTSPRGISIEDGRQQRAGLLLRDVAYVIRARIRLRSSVNDPQAQVKYREMFLRRASKGQCFQRPYLGCREFAASFELLDGWPPNPFPLSEERGRMLYDIDPRHLHILDKVGVTKELGWMLFDIDYSRVNRRPQFFKASLVQGRLVVPPPASPEVCS